MSKCIIHLESLIDLSDGSHVSEVKVEGDKDELGGMLEGAMVQNYQLAALVVASAVYFATDHDIDLAEFQNRYRQTGRKG